MHDFITIYEFGETTPFVLISIIGIIIGIVFIFVTIYGVIFRRSTKELKNAIISGLLTLIILSISISGYLKRTSYLKELKNSIINGTCKMVEGPVHILFRQLATGHSKGDVLEVGGIQFEVDYFKVSSFYKQTIAHGGALKEGVYVRIFYDNGNILKIDMKKQRRLENKRVAP